MRKYVLLALFLTVFLFIGAVARSAVLAGSASQESAPPADAKGEEVGDTAEVEVISIGGTSQDAAAPAVSDLLAPSLVLGPAMMAEAGRDGGGRP